MPEQLEKDLRDFLLHFYDPAYRPAEPLLAVTGCRGDHDADCVRSAIIQAIDSLNPGPEVPLSARSRRLYQVLYHRFVQDKTQEEASELVGLTTRHLRREEQEAVSLLARRLMELMPGRVAAEAGRGADSGQAIPVPSRESPVPVWLSQVQQELALLQKGSPASATNVAEAVNSVAALSRALGSQRGIEIIVEPVDTGLLATIHPSIFRQAMVMVFETLLERINGGKITWSAQRAAGGISVLLASSPVPPEVVLDLEPIQAILATQSGSCSVVIGPEQLAVRLDLPGAGNVSVLVIDDNTDMVYLYRRYVSGTRYSIQTFVSQEPVFKQIEAHLPDLIVLDVMMPDADGWQLLTQLHEHTLTRTIPVIICSVIKGEQMALALGATLYLSKPISRNQFLQALDTASRSIGREKQC